MEQFQLLKKLLPGLLPLVMFVIVDEFFGTTAGLVVAVSLGIAELLFTYFKSKVLDKFTLFDTLLIVILGSVSYILENDVFFKLKPALVGGILCVLLGISTFSRMNLVSMMSKRYLGGINLNDQQVRQFDRSVRVLFYIVSFHTLLVLYSAFFMSKEAWAFISTVVLYLLFGGYLVYEILKGRIRQLRYRKEEWVPLVDDKGTIVGKAPRSLVHTKKDMLHPVVHLHVINGKRQVYLQKRPPTKLVEPGKWDVSVGGHVALGENVEATLTREAKEEIGISDFHAVPVCHYVLKTDRESELVFLLYTNYDGPIQINTTELEDGRFWAPAELNRRLGTGMFTPSFEIEYSLLKRNSIL
jgi:isopentenyldiphosphate isomerase/intracellular septation protein A